MSQRPPHVPGSSVVVRLVSPNKEGPIHGSVLHIPVRRNVKTTITTFTGTVLSQNILPKPSKYLKSKTTRFQIININRIIAFAMKTTGSA